MNLNSHLLDGDLLALELADGDGLDGLPEPLPPGAEGHDVLRRVDHALNLHNDEIDWNEKFSYFTPLIHCPGLTGEKRKAWL